MAYHVMLAKQRQDDRNQEHLTTPSHSGRWDGGQENVAKSPETPGLFRYIDSQSKKKSFFFISN